MELLFLLQIGISLWARSISPAAAETQVVSCTQPEINLSLKKSFSFFCCRDHMSGVANDLTVYGVERHDFVDCYALVLPSLPFQLSLTPVSAPVLAIAIEINSSQ